MEWKLELVIVPVADVDRAKQFYSEQVGFNVDHDTRISDQLRVVQLTPPGSGCSIAIGTGMTEMAPGAIKGLQLVVSDVAAAREPTHRAGRGGQPGTAFRGWQLDRWAGRALELVRLLRRSRRQ